MTGNSLVVQPENKPFEWYEDFLPVRGVRLSLAEVKELYDDLSKINSKFGETVVERLDKPDDWTISQWTEEKARLRDNGFRLSVVIKGEGDQRVFGDNNGIFVSPNLPNPIKSIYFDNMSAFKTIAGNAEPENRFEVALDFGKPTLFDPSPLVSEATPNSGNVTIEANDMGFIRSVQQVVSKRLTDKRTRNGFIHKNFSYDFGLWFFALPLALFYSSFYMDKYFGTGSEYEAYKWAFFIYANGMMLLFYRFLTSYAKWAFPVNVLAENKDRAAKHRWGLGVLLTSLAVKTFETIFQVACKDCEPLISFFSSSGS